MRAVIAESYERIHRCNLVGMGIVPLQFLAGQNAASLGLTGEEVYETVGLPTLLEGGFAGGRELTVRATAADGKTKEFTDDGAHRHAAGDRSTTSTAASCTTSCASSPLLDSLARLRERVGVRESRFPRRPVNPSAPCAQAELHDSRVAMLVARVDQRVRVSEREELRNVGRGAASPAAESQRHHEHELPEHAVDQPS